MEPLELGGNALLLFGRGDTESKQCCSGESYGETPPKSSFFAPFIGVVASFSELADCDRCTDADGNRLEEDLPCQVAQNRVGAKNPKQQENQSRGQDADARRDNCSPDLPTPGFPVVKATEMLQNQKNEEIECIKQQESGRRDGETVPPHFHRHQNGHANQEAS